VHDGQGKKWWAWQGLNLRPLRCQHSAYRQKPQKSAIFAFQNGGTRWERSANRARFYRTVTALENPMIYFIQAGSRGLVKIGFSGGHPRQRMACLQIGSPVKLRLIGMSPGNQKDEAEWHRRFAHLREHGEWFRWAGDLRRAAKPFLRETAERAWRKLVHEYAETIIFLRSRGSNPKMTNPDILAEIERLST
jgi:hypothetical protein